MALCILLAFWTGKDAERMDRLFRNSGLFRDKWDEPRGERHFEKLRGVRDWDDDEDYENLDDDDV